MTTFDEILIIANQLANQGKKPTVALLKSRLTTSFPLPMIIKVLKSWQHDPEFISISNQQTCEKALLPAVDESQEIKLIIENSLMPIKAELEDIKSQLALLIANNQKK